MDDILIKIKERLEHVYHVQRTLVGRRHKLAIVVHPDLVPVLHDQLSTVIRVYSSTRQIKDRITIMSERGARGMLGYFKAAPRRRGKLWQ